jgi:adenylate cyclase
MFTDMIGYTSLGQKNEELSLALVEEQRKVIRPVVARHNGREIKTIGDAFLVEFQSALDAVRCAYDIQRATREFNVSTAEDRRIHLRVGIHLGDVVEYGGDISGDAVNVASRIEPLAEDGGVCLSSQVKESVQNKINLHFMSIGEKSLKNVIAPMEVFRIVMPWEKEGDEPALNLDSKRLAVLPFVSMSPDPNDEYFADGLTEELIAKISMIEGLEVIARTSVMGFKKKDKKATEIARELKVGTLLEGSVRKAGNKIRVTAQLINANTEGHLWAESYDRNLDDIFAVQSSVAENVAGALKLKLFEGGKAGSESKVSLDAYTSFLRASQLYNERSEASLKEALELLHRAVSKGPTFARAYASLANVWLGLDLYEDSVGSRRNAEEAARKAVELDSESAEAHEALGAVHEAMDRFNEARSEAEKALRINPNLAEAHYRLGSLDCLFGRFEEGIAHLKKAWELDPLSVKTGFLLTHCLRVAGRIDDALAVLDRFKDLHPRSPYMYDSFATLFFQTKQFDKAEEYISAGLRYDPDNWALKVDRGCLNAYLGKRTEAEEELKKLINEGDVQRDMAQFFIRTALEDVDEAFEALMRQAELHTWWMMVHLDPLTEILRRDPRFSEFRMKVGLPSPDSMV